MIRMLTEGDVGSRRFRELAAACYRESGIPSEFDPDVFVDSWLRYMRAGFVVAYGWFPTGYGGLLRGGIGGLVHPCLMSREVLGQEVFWYVEPEQRRAREAAMLLPAFEDGMREAGATVISLPVRKSMSANLPRRLERRGYSERERTFSLKLAS